MGRRRVISSNKKCENPYCNNDIIRISPKVDKKYCKACQYVYEIGWSGGRYTKVRKK